MPDYPEEAVLDNAINEAMRMGDDGLKEGVVVGWYVCVAYRTPKMLDSESARTGYAFFAPSGQPQYASVGLLNIFLDTMLDVQEFNAGDEGIGDD